MLRDEEEPGLFEPGLLELGLLEPGLFERGLFAFGLFELGLFELGFDPPGEAERGEEDDEGSPLGVEEEPEREGELCELDLSRLSRSFGWVIDNS